MKYVCSVCGNDKGLGHENFYHNRELISESNYCNECHTITDWEEKAGIDAGVERDRVATSEKEANYVGKINEYIQKTGLDGSVRDYARITRTGGRDHNPKFKVVIDLKGIRAEAEGYFSKKDCTHIAATKWWENAGDLVNNTSATSKQVKSDLPLLEKLADVEREIRQLKKEIKLLLAKGKV